MKRRSFLKTVGGAAGVMTLGAAVVPQQAGAKGSKKFKSGRKQEHTYALGPLDPPDQQTPFKQLWIRSPGWFPDGADVGSALAEPLFQEEVVGIKKVQGKDHIVPFGIPFPDFAKKDPSNIWALGHKLKQGTGGQTFTDFVRRLALRARQYNGSLYRLRRLHFYWYYQDQAAGTVDWPGQNPDGKPKETEAPDPKDLGDFQGRVTAAETDWMQVTDQLNSLLESGRDNSGNYKPGKFAADMVTANGYIISMRVVIMLPGKEPGGSSSHISISSAFSSSSPNPYT